MFTGAPGVVLADECVSVRDSNGYFMSYVHLSVRCRLSNMKRWLDAVDGIVDYKVVHYSRVIQNTYHFWSIALGIARKYESLLVETTKSQDHVVFGPLKLKVGA
jgi:hypothetical protein